MFIWKVKCFSKLLRQAKAGEVLNTASSPFYSDRSESYGYKLKVRIDPNGDGSGKNTHLSMFIVVMEGEYDAMHITLAFQKESEVYIDRSTGRSSPGGKHCAVFHTR